VTDLAAAVVRLHVYSDLAATIISRDLAAAIKQSPISSRRPATAPSTTSPLPAAAVMDRRSETTEQVWREMRGG
jgi:hypothetical protein